MSDSFISQIFLHTRRVDLLSEKLIILMDDVSHTRRSIVPVIASRMILHTRRVQLLSDKLY